MATYLNIETHRILPGIKCDGQRILQASEPHLTAYCADNIDIIRMILNYEGKTIRSVYTTCGVVEQTEVVIHILRRYNRYTFKSGKNESEYTNLCALLRMVSYLESKECVKTVWNRSRFLKPHWACYWRSGWGQSCSNCAIHWGRFLIRSMKKSCKIRLSIYICWCIICFYEAFWDKDSCFPNLYVTGNIKNISDTLLITISIQRIELTVSCTRSTIELWIQN